VLIFYKLLDFEQIA